MNRNRLYQFFLITLTVVLGVSSRKYSALLPGIVGEYAGDVLWALMVFLLTGFIFKSKSTLWVAVVALLFSYFIELTQFYHAPFIDSIRATTIGGLILGNTFVWTDILCYNMGVLLGALIEKLR